MVGEDMMAVDDAESPRAAGKRPLRDGTTSRFFDTAPVAADDSDGEPPASLPEAGEQLMYMTTSMYDFNEAQRRRAQRRSKRARHGAR